MRNVLLSEYETLLSATAAKHGAVGGAKLDRSTARWAGVHNLSVDIELRSNLDYRSDYRSLVPRVWVCAQSALPADPALALAICDDSRATIVRALIAFTEVQGLVVWRDEAPCDLCGAKGTTRSGPCATCGGTGKRGEVARG